MHAWCNRQNGVLERVWSSSKATKIDRIITEFGDHSLTLSYARHIGAEQAKVVGVQVVRLLPLQRRPGDCPNLAPGHATVALVTTRNSARERLVIWHRRFRCMTDRRKDTHCVHVSNYEPHRAGERQGGRGMVRPVGRHRLL
jgi:hypothetical protein